MRELRADGVIANISLYPPESANIINVLKFRLRCRQESKIGVVMLPFGQAFYVDALGNYMDGKIPPAEAELADVLKALDGTVVDPARETDTSPVPENAHG